MKLKFKFSWDQIDSVNVGRKRSMVVLQRGCARFSRYLEISKTELSSRRIFGNRSCNRRPSLQKRLVHLLVKRPPANPTCVCMCLAPPMISWLIDDRAEWQHVVDSTGHAHTIGSVLRLGRQCHSVRTALRCNENHVGCARHARSRPTRLQGVPGALSRSQSTRPRTNLVNFDVCERPHECASRAPGRCRPYPRSEKDT